MRSGSVSIAAATAQVARFCLPLFLVLLTACAKPTDPARIPVNPAFAADVWNRFMAASNRQESLSGPFRLNATLYYSGKEDSQRVTVYFWGNGEKDAPLPLRLDILMGPGSVMAAAREDSRGLFIHVPREETVYHTRDSGLLAFDVPVPFSLADLSFLVTGNAAGIFAPDGTALSVPPVEMGADGALVFAVEDSPLGGFVTIGPDGLLRGWTDGPDTGWTLGIEYWPDSTRTTPRKLSMRHAGGREATLIVRDLAYPDTFTPKQLELAVPEGTRLAPLDVTP